MRLWGEPKYNSGVEPVRIIIIGATGDLAKKKLFKALFGLFSAGKLPEKLDIIGAARTPYSDSEFREYVASYIGDKPNLSVFLSHCRYIAGDFTSPQGYDKLARVLALAQECTHTLWYLAVSPDLYAPIFECLSNSGMALSCVTKNGKSSWVRIAVEKPFGRDSAGAEALEQLLCASFAEEQIFRIDHYLAKESLENILAFRFGNTLLEPIWNRTHIQRVHIQLLEPFGIEGRGAFYDGFGALRDVGQNHLLQMLAMVAMEPPNTFDADGIRSARSAALAAVVTDQHTAESTVLGQYASYRTERGVAPDSVIDTYFKTVAYVDTPRFAGVPFILEAGKKMHTHTVSITVEFTPASALPAQGTSAITFSLSPKETIGLRFMAKHPGYGFTLAPRELSFAYDDGTADTPKDAYEKLLHDAIIGNRTLFLSNSEVAHSWRFIRTLTDSLKGSVPVVYTDGTTGPVV
jgi:glucose-6-phosphate 1-dehydrogenase